MGKKEIALQKIAAIKNATIVGENTAERVGDAMEAMMDAHEDYVTKNDFAELSAEVAGGCARISLAGAANTMVSVRFYGVCAGHTYRLYIQRPSVDMTGVTYTGSTYVMLQIIRRDKSGNKMPLDTDVILVGCNKKSEPLAAYYDIPIDASMTEIDHIQVAMRAADGWVQWFQLEDITESVNDKGYIPNISLIGTGNDIAYSAFYKGVKGGRKYRILIKTPNIDMSGVTNKNSRLIIYLVNLATMVVDTTSQIVRWNKADTLPDYYDLTVPDDGINYALHYCMRATAGAEQILEVIDMTDFGEGGGGGEIYPPDPISATGQDGTIVTSSLTTVGRLINGHTYRCHLSNPNIDISNVNVGPSYEVFSIGRRVLDGSTVITSVIVVKVTKAEYPMAEYYDVTIPNDGQQWQIRIGMRANAGQVQTLSFEDITPEEEDDSKEEGGSSMLSLRQGYIDENGKVIPSATHLHTSPIAGGRGFHFLLNDGYEINNIHLFDSSGNLVSHSYFPLAVNCVPFSRYPGVAGARRTYFANASVPQGYYFVLIITKVDTSGGTPKAITTSDRCVKEFDYTDRYKALPVTAEPWVGTQSQYDALTADEKASLDCVIVEGDTAVPYIKKANAEAARKRYMRLLGATWKAKANIPCDNTTQGWRDYFFLADRVRCGISYSEAAQYAKYVGCHVSVYTYLTAIKNKRSVMYTEDMPKNKSAYGITYGTGLGDFLGSYYGTVCSGLTAYVMCLPNIYHSKFYNPAQSGHIDGLVRVENATAENVMPLDIIWNDGHVSFILDILVDEQGKRKFIMWAEQTPPSTNLTPFTPEIFEKRLADKQCVVSRWSGWDAVTEDNEEWSEGDDLVSQVERMDMPIDLPDMEVCTMYGDKACIGVDDVLFLNCFRGDGKYATLHIEKESGGAWSEVSSRDLTSGTGMSADTLYDDGEDWVKCQLTRTLAYGHYRAYLEGDDGTSGYTYWEVLDTTASVSGSFVSFANDYGTPYLVRSETSSTFMQSKLHIVTDAEAQQGSAAIWATVSGENIKVFWRGDYGVAIKMLTT